MFFFFLLVRFKHLVCVSECAIEMGAEKWLPRKSFLDNNRGGTKSLSPGHLTKEAHSQAVRLLAPIENYAIILLFFPAPHLFLSQVSFFCEPKRGLVT